MADIVIVAAIFAAGFCIALSLVGYGILGGLRQIVSLWRYRNGRCKCGLCS